jgi:hypothetical protein
MRRSFLPDNPSREQHDTRSQRPTNYPGDNLHEEHYKVLLSEQQPANMAGNGMEMGQWAEQQPRSTSDDPELPDVSICDDQILSIKPPKT